MKNKEKEIARLKKVAEKTNDLDLKKSIENKIKAIKNNLIVRKDGSN